MFGAGVSVESTPEIEQSLVEWKEKAKAYLSEETDEWEYQKDSQ